MSVHCRRTILRNWPPTAACQTLVKMVGSAITAIMSESGRKSAVTAIVTVGKPRPTNPFTAPAKRKTDSTKTICPVVIRLRPSSEFVPPRGDGGDQRHQRHDLDHDQPPVAARSGGQDFGALDLLAD